jgi:hypothetical protein
MDGGRKRKIETRGAEAAEEEQRKKLQAKLGKVHCNYCKRDVSDQMYIKSAVSIPNLIPCTRRFGGVAAATDAWCSSRVRMN